MENFLYSLFGKRKRRILILTRWHARQTPPLKSESLEQLVQHFFECLLYEPTVLSLYKTHLKVFNVPGLFIYYEWLFPHEMTYVQDLLDRRYEVPFSGRDTFVDGTFALTGLREANLCAQHRRELVRDFCWLVTANRQDKALWEYTLTLVLQQMLLRKEGPVDPLVVELHSALQGRAPLRNVLCIYP